MPIDVQSFLKDWGMTLGILALAATSFFILLLVGLREFATWYLRLNQLGKTQKSILGQLQSIETQIEIQNANYRKLQLVPTAVSEEKPAVPEKHIENKFPLKDLTVRPPDGDVERFKPRGFTIDS